MLNDKRLACIAGDMTVSKHGERKGKKARENVRGVGRRRGMTSGYRALAPFSTR